MKTVMRKSIETTTQILSRTLNEKPTHRNLNYIKIITNLLPQTPNPINRS